MWGLIIGAAAVAGGIGVAWWVRSRHSPAVMPYGELRAKMIRAGGSAEAARGQPPQRPPGLDGRLPMADYEALRAAKDGVEGPRGWFEEYLKVVDSIRAELEAIDRHQQWYELLSPGRRAVLLLDELEMEINNGGFDQYYLNSSGDGATLGPESLRLLGLEDLATLVERANNKFRSGVPQDRGVRMAALEKLSGAWDELDEEFFRMETPDGGWGQNVGARYIVEHPQEFFVDR